MDLKLEQEACEDKNCFVEAGTRVYKDELLTSAAIFALLYAFCYCREFNKPPSTASSSLYVAAERIRPSKQHFPVSYKPRRINDIIHARKKRKIY